MSKKLFRRLCVHSCQSDRYKFHMMIHWCYFLFLLLLLLLLLLMFELVFTTVIMGAGAGGGLYAL